MPDLLRLIPLGVLDHLIGGDAHFGRFEGLQAAPHRPLEDLLDLVLILVDTDVAPAVPVSMLKIRHDDTGQQLRSGPEACQSFYS